MFVIRGPNLVAPQTNNTDQRKRNMDSSKTEKPTSREEMARLLNDDLAREYQAIIAYVVYS